MRALLPLLFLSALPLAAQPKPQPTPSPAPAPAPARAQAESSALRAALTAAGNEPGAQIRQLQAFLRKYPHPAQAPAIYRLLIKDADALNSFALSLHYNERLQQADPGDLAQRIRTLNLLLLNTDPASIARARRYADQLAVMVDKKATEAPPADVGAAEWTVDMNRLKALAALFQGTAAQLAHDYSAAATHLQTSLHLEQTQEAADHLARVEMALHRPQAAIQAYALALALPGDTIAQRAQLLARARAVYRAQHAGSDTGLGDLILRRFDDVAAQNAREQALLHPHSPKKVRHASDIQMLALDGQHHSLAELNGKVAVLDFWATWCGPCRLLHPILLKLAHQYARNPHVAFVSINEDQDPSQVGPFLAREHWDRSTWLDNGLGAYWGVDALPTIIILDPHGHQVFRKDGFVPETIAKELAQAIQTTLDTPAAAARKRTH